MSTRSVSTCAAHGSQQAHACVGFLDLTAMRQAVAHEFGSWTCDEAVGLSAWQAVAHARLLMRFWLSQGTRITAAALSRLEGVQSHLLAPPIPTCLIPSKSILMDLGRKG